LHPAPLRPSSAAPSSQTKASVKPSFRLFQTSYALSLITECWGIWLSPESSIFVAAALLEKKISLDTSMHFFYTFAGLIEKNKI
jgi:hypothetical protein